MSLRPQEDHGSTSSKEDGFLGFRPLQSNTTYTPNQFFDVCLPHCSRGCIRIVGYMIRRTLGWCDADGNPQESQIKISWGELIKKARISRGSLGPALKEAVEMGFITREREGRRDQKGSSGESALYQLRWDEETPHYVKDPEEFNGFFAHGQGGNRTDIPNQYFDVVIPTEPLAVIKIVGVIMRYSIGFQTATGTRRQRVALAYSQICKRVNISSRTTVSKGLKTAIEKNYILQLVKGGMSVNREEQITSIYGVRWTDTETFGTPSAETGSENGPENSTPPQKLVQKMDQRQNGTSSKNEPADRFEKWTETGSNSGPAPVQKADQKSGSESGLNKTKILKKTLINEKLKQQPPHLAVAEEILNSVSLLQEIGFAESQAIEIASLPEISDEIIKQQIQWLDARNPKKNRLGLLRKAIVENWDEPGQSTVTQSPAYRFAEAFYTRISGPRQAWEEPSQNDLRLGASFLGALETDEEPESIGDRFGKFCKSGKMSFPSLTASLRTEGKAFFQAEQKQKQAQLKADEKAEKARREAALVDKEKAWHKYLWDQEAQFKSRRSEDYQKFLLSRDEARRNIEEENQDSAGFAKMLLNMHDSEEVRLSEFQEFFSGEIPDLQSFGI